MLFEPSCGHVVREPGPGGGEQVQDGVLAQSMPGARGGRRPGFPHARCMRFHFHSSTAQNTQGTMNRVMRLTAMPPTDGIAIGCITSEPRPVAQKMGMRPKT